RAWNRPNGPYPPMPGGPGNGAPPGRFIPFPGPAAGPHGRTPGPRDAFSGHNGNNGPNGHNGYDSHSGHNGHNGASYAPPYARGGSGPLPPPGPYRAPFPPTTPRRWPTPGAPLNGHHANYAPPGRRFPDSFPSNGHAELRPPGFLTPANGHRGPAPSNYATGDHIDRGRVAPPVPRPGHVSSPNGQAMPGNGKRPFTPLQDYL